MRSLRLSALAVALGFCPILAAQTTRPADSGLPSTQPAAASTQLTVAGTQPQAASSQPAFASTRPATTLPSADSFIPRLASDKFQQREQAEDELVRLGEDARPIIHELLNRPLNDDEVRNRLEAALAQIDSNRTTGPSFITIHLENATCKTVFAELSRQCYADLKAFPDTLLDQPDLPKVSINVDHVPFWTAMAQISEKTGIDFQQYMDGTRLMRGGFHQNSKYARVHGPFLIIPIQITRTQTEVLANNGGSSSDFSMQIMAYSEPKLRVLSSNSIVKLEEVADDAGNSLVPTGPENRGYYGGSGGVWNLFAPLKYPDHPGTKIAVFKGSSSFVIQTKSERIEIPEIKTMKEVSKVIGDMPVLFHELKKAGDTWELRLSANPQALGPTRWGQFNQSVQTSLKLLDDKGVELDHRGMRSQGNNNGIEFTILYGQTGRAMNGRGIAEPAKLVWEVPTGSKEIRVAFDFKDLPMPK